MAQVTKRENMVISIREYQDNQGQNKKVWKTIGELITWDDGHQSFEQWGPGGVVKGGVFEQQDKQQQQAYPTQQNSYQKQNNNNQFNQQQR